MNVVKKTLAAIALLLFNPLGNAALAARLDAEAVERIIALESRAEQSRLERLAAIRAALTDLKPNYQTLIADLPAASEEELSSIWRLSSFMAFVTNEFSFAGNMMLVQDEYSRRKIVPPIELRQHLLESLIRFRRFDEARSYAAKEALKVEYLPRIEGTTQKPAKPLGVLRPDPDRRVLLRESYGLDEEVHVFVLSFIGCVFSRHAAEAIENHERLGRLMREHSTWIVLPGLLHFNDVVAWNRSHPSTQFVYVDDMPPWSFIDDWSTPTFYFVKHGKLVYKLTGWPDDTEGISALLQALAATGLDGNAAIRK